ncbi:hypothetical protein RUM43_006824 [Polyplax serrata]|uniref:Large ribosomal subunit protein mL37 n=1 Tax=Polyplax serrata TaxID=468196 RepID=A0AAN8PW87_POLSC
MRKWNWYTKGKVEVRPTPAKELLERHGYEVVDVKDVLFPPTVRERVEIVGTYDKILPFDENHPDYKTEPCYKYMDRNVLLEGTQQAQVLTNTIAVKEFPEHMDKFSKNLKLPDNIHSEVQKRIMLSCVFEATQQKLPKKKDPFRPAWVFPRDYGIPDTRKNELLTKNLVELCDNYINDRSRSVVSDVKFCAPVNAHSKNLLFELTSEVVVTTSKRLQSLSNSEITIDLELPNLHPVDCTISLEPFNFYEMKNIYPFNTKSKYPFVQTAFLSYNHTIVKNIFEEIVTEDQKMSRCLMKGFTIAAAQAHALYGEDVEELPEPLVIPVVQSDGQFFDFSLYQLNTLAIDKQSNIKNIFWNSPTIALYEKCQYESGRPVLQGYNSDIINKIISFMSIE